MWRKTIFLNSLFQIADKLMEKLLCLRQFSLLSDTGCEGWYPGTNKHLFQQIMGLVLLFYTLATKTPEQPGGAGSQIWGDEDDGLHGPAVSSNREWFSRALSSPCRNISWWSTVWKDGDGHSIRVSCAACRWWTTGWWPWGWMSWSGRWNALKLAAVCADSEGNKIGDETQTQYNVADKESNRLYMS